MNKRIYIIIFLLTCRICDAQNLVPNGDFELYDGCPTWSGQLNSLSFWFNPTTATPDYYHSCANSNIWVGVPANYAGFQFAHSGEGYAGMLLFADNFAGDYHEYAEVQLTSTLIANTCYHFEMFISSAEYNGKYVTDDIGVYFSDTIITGIPNAFTLVLPAQINNATGNYPDTANWTLVSGNYTATGSETYLIIGNFKTNANTDTILYNSTAPFDMAYVYVDNVSLTPCTAIEEQNQNDAIKIYPNPFNNKLTFRKINNEQSEIILYDITSRKLLQQSFTNSTSINTEQLAKGLYLYEVRSKNGSCKKGKVVKD